MFSIAAKFGSGPAPSGLGAVLGKANACGVFADVDELAPEVPAARPCGEGSSNKRWLSKRAAAEPKSSAWSCGDNPSEVASSASAAELASCAVTASSLTPLIVMASCVAVKCESSGLPSCSRMGEGRDESLKKREKLATALVESIAGGAAETRKSGARERDRGPPYRYES